MFIYFLFFQLLAWTFAQTNFTNPIIWQDLPDIDLILHGDAYYYSASTFHFSPGAVIARSYDLVNWEYLSHSVPSLDFETTEGFDLVSGPGQRYNQGIFASYFNYRKSTDTFYWGGCIVGDWKTLNNILMVPDDGWHTVNKGDEIEGVEVSGTTIWLRLEVGVNSLYDQEGRFSFSTDGVNFESLGEPHQEIDRGFVYFMGYRYGVFNYATLARGGAVTIKSLSIRE
ncbi:glycosyl hydrolase [Colletotrichum phormii]|uniref:Glycosyl hydrolase n=1 Tax=Colletotrichum phormii TaxID=359342 RepID=A0AAI9ZSL7_9PEZI|nr:glycosyl hydrolase [Colletotrichum phormii]KAK1635912.1 glycosyl hydrolase [Colletotrichum phormii]